MQAERSLHFIDQKEHPLRCPVVEASQVVAALLGFRVDVSHLELIGHSLTQYLFAAFGGEPANVGDDVAACFDGGDHIGVNGTG